MEKSRQHKRRLTYAGFLALYANVLPLGGEIWFKTDNDPLFAFSLEQFAQEGWELREVTHDLHADGPVGVMTDYEAKFYDQGITINRCVAVKRRTRNATCILERQRAARLCDQGLCGHVPRAGCGYFLPAGDEAPARADRARPARLPSVLVQRREKGLLRHRRVHEGRAARRAV